MISKKKITDSATTEVFEKLSARDKRFFNTLAKNLIANYYADGHLTDKDLSLTKEKFAEKIKAITDRTDFKFVIDHRDSILNEALSFYEKKEFSLAKIMYAMFFEHSINELITNYSTKKKFDEKTRIDIIKSVDMHGKLTWLLKVFEFPLFNEAHKKTIKKVADDRNAFIHYKWKVQEEENYSKPNLYSDEFKKIKQAVVYMKRYETNVKFNKNKKHLATKLKFN